MNVLFFFRKQPVEACRRFLRESRSAQLMNSAGMRRRALRRRLRGEESGAALISALSLIFIASLLVAGVLSMSKYGTFTMGAHLDLQKSMYLNEGAGNRVQWLLAAERQNLQAVNYAIFNYSDYDYERYLPDGKVHTFDYHGTAMRFSLRDPLDVSDLSSSGFRNTLNYMKRYDPSDSELSEKLDILSALLTDYSDSDSDLSTDGREADDYESLSMQPLPRNNTMEFREELLYIPEILSYFPVDSDGRLSYFRVIPPTGMTLTGKPSIYMQNIFYLSGLLNLTETEREQIVAALATLKEGESLVTLADSLDASLLAKVQSGNHLRWNPSGNYEVCIEPAFESGNAGDSSSPGNGNARRRPARRLTFTLTSFPVAGPSGGFISFMEYFFY